MLDSVVWSVRVQRFSICDQVTFPGPQGKLWNFWMCEGFSCFFGLYFLDHVGVILWKIGLITECDDFTSFIFL